MTLKPSLLNALKKATTLVISVDKTTIELIPHTRIRQSGGAFALVAGAPRDPQDFYIEAPNTSTLSGIAQTTGGLGTSVGAQYHSWDYTITGTADCEMEINDQWTNGETTYRITAIQPFNGYERIGIVTAIGKDPSYGQ